MYQTDLSMNKGKKKKQQNQHDLPPSSSIFCLLIV